MEVMKIGVDMYFCLNSTICFNFNLKDITIIE